MTVKTPTINHITLAGNLTKDAKVEHLGQDMTAVGKFTMANNGHYRDKSGDWHDMTTFVNVEIWGAAAERLETYGKKGVPIMVEGALRQDNWTDNDGVKHQRMLIRAERLYQLEK